MKSNSKRGPKKGKRVTREFQAEVVLEALHSDRSIRQTIEKYRNEGYNFSEALDSELESISKLAVTFMLVNKPILEFIHSQAVNDVIHNIKAEK